MARPALACVVLAALCAPCGARAQDEGRVKIAVIVAGDPDDVLRARARELEDALAATDDLLLPSDPALRAALRGEPGQPDDGLERARAERRKLGLDEAGDLRALRALGRMTGAAAVVVVRRGPDGIEALVMDVGRAAFFESQLTLPDARAAGFVTPRARASARAAVSTATPSREAPATPPDAPDNGEGAEDEAGGILSEWPLIVAGALLVGFLLFFTLGDDPAEPGPPVLRFEAGGS